MESYHVEAYHRIYRIASHRVESHHITVMRDHTFSILYARNVYQSIPESVVSPGIALAISAMAFPSCCILPVLASITTALVVLIIIAKRTTPMI